MKYRINKDKNIGNVVFVLEGSKTEFNVLETIFVKLLGYEMSELKRKNDGFVFKGKNPYSKIIALNFRGNHLYEINSEELNHLYFKMSSELGLKPESLPIYYIYDRDVKSYDLNQARAYVEKYCNPYDNNDGSQGLLLLSYPAIESYIISCFLDKTYNITFETGHELKAFIGSNKYNQQMIRTDKELLHAITELDEYLESVEAGYCNIDNFRDTNIRIYDSEQKYYIENGTFQLVSLLSVVLLDLGIIENINSN